jgi:hypothetical protein
MPMLARQLARRQPWTQAARQHAGRLAASGGDDAGAQTQQRSGAALRTARSSLGLRGLYVGFWPATLGALPSEGAYVVALEAARQALAPSSQQQRGGQGEAAEAAASFAAGAAANVASQALLSPVEVVVARAVVAYDPKSTRAAASVADVARATWRAHGLRGFYAGYFAVRHA